MVKPQFDPTVSFKVRCFDEDLSWCQTVEAKVKTGSGTDAAEAGHILAYSINRDKLAGNYRTFHYHMDAPSQDICDVATTLFDQHGQLKQHLQGTFGRETNQGSLLYVRDVILEKPYQNQGIGCKAVTSLLQQLNASSNSSQLACWHFAVMHQEESEKSWRAAGFRTINRTQYLGCCNIKDHRCWDQEAPDQMPTSEPEPEPLSNKDNALLQVIQIGLQMPAQPVSIEGLRYAIEKGAHVDKAHALHHVAAHGWNEAVHVLLDCGANIDAQDHMGCTALHVAAQAGHPEIVKLLLETGADSAVRDIRGYAALDGCILAMKSLRDFSSGMLGQFKGYDGKSMSIVRILCNAGADENLTPGLTVPKRKEGCSCGKCIEAGSVLACAIGIPWQLNFQQLWQCDTSRDNITAYPCNLVDNMADVWQFDFVPLKLREKVTKQFVKGWVGLLDMITSMLEAKIVPTAKAVKRAGLWRSLKKSRFNNSPSAIRHFLEHGGRAEYAIDATLEQFRDTNEVTGDASDDFFIQNGDDDDVQRRAEYEALPACDNDFDFQLLSQHLCNDGLMPNGPHFQRHDMSHGNTTNHTEPADTSDEDECDEQETDAEEDKDAADDEE